MRVVVLLLIYTPVIFYLLVYTPVSNIQYIQQTIRSNLSCMMPFMKKKKKVVNYFGFETIIVHTV